MPLVFQLETCDPALGENALRRIEVASRLTIGRGADNDLVLPDPQRHLSKTHCIIVYDAHGGTVTDTSTNGVFLDDHTERLPRNVPMPLVEGSLLRFGGYQISVTAIAPSLPLAAGPPPRPGPLAASSDDGLFGDPLAAPFIDEHGSAPVFPSDAFASDAVSPDSNPLHGSGMALIPDDADIFGNPPAQPSWQGASQSDHTPSDQVYFAPPKVTSQLIPDDWDLGDLAAPIAGAPERRVAFDPSVPLRTPLASAAPRASIGDSAAVAGFLAAVGLKDVALSDSEKLSLMQRAGEIFATMTRGLSDILAARASTKQEFRIERTTIGAARNNPLKFSGSTEEAIRVMLLGRTPGFAAGKEAVDEALDDIKSHQLAVLAGMQIALATVIARFDPDKLEKRLEQSSLIEGILPAARKARYWELFKSLYKEIATELEEDFQKAFGAEFARAYRKQIDKL